MGENLMKIKHIIMDVHIQNRFKTFTHHKTCCSNNCRSKKYVSSWFVMTREQEIFMIFVILIKSSCNHLVGVWMPICTLNITFWCTFRCENGKATICSAFMAEARLEQLCGGFKQALIASKYFWIDIYTMKVIFYNVNQL